MDSNSGSKFKYRDTSCYQSSRRYQSFKGCFDTKSVAIADFIDRVPFQLFITLRPLREISMATLKQRFSDIISTIEKDRLVRAPISYIVGFESFPEVHLHSCLASTVKLSPELIPSTELEIATMGKAWEFHSSTVQKQFNCEIQRIYSANVLPYVLKTLNRNQDGDWHITRDGDWDMGNLDLYLNTTGNKHQRDRLKRHQKRLNRAA